MEPLYLAFYQITDFAVKKCNILGFVTFTVGTGLHEGVSNYVELDVALKWSIIPSFTLEGYLEPCQTFKMERIKKIGNS